MMDSIYGMRPVNKTAGVVTAQNGCGDGRLTDDQKRENLAAKYRQLHEYAKTLPKKSKEKASIGLQLQEMAGQLTDLNARIKNRRKLPDLGESIIEIVREDMTRFQFQKLVERARERHEKKMAEYESEDAA